MSYSIAKLTSTTSSERALYSGIVEHESDPMYGQLIYIIDIPLPSIISEPVAKEIINTIQEEYFDVERKTAIYQFEDCIKQLNAALSFIAEQGNNEWIGHIHSLVALLVGNEVFISHSGRATAAVIRGSLYTPIINLTQNPGQRILAHKTYANLVSGQLSENDFLIFGNSEIGRHFSPQFLNQAAEDSPTATVQKMYQAGRRLNLKNIATIVAKLEPDDSFAPTNPYSITLDQPLEMTASSLIPKFASTDLKTVRTNTVNLLKPIKTVAKLAFKTLHSLVKQLRNPKTNLEYIAANQPEIKSYHHSSHTSLKRTPGQKLVNNLERLYSYVVLALSKTLTLRKHLSSKYLIVVGIIIIAILALTIGGRISRNNSASPRNSETIAQTETIKELLDEANQLKQEKPENARDQLSQAKSILDKLPNSKDQTIIDLKQKYISLMSEINNITLIDDKNKTAVPKDTKDILVIGQYLFITKNSSADIFRQTLGKPDPEEKIFSTPNKSNIKLVNLNEPTRQLTILTESNILYIYSLDNQSSSAELTPPQGENWPNIRSVTWYQKNLYILEDGSGVIWKYISTDGIKFSAKSPYLSSPEFSSRDATDIASDGSIYILFGSGSVSKLTRGNKQGFGPLSLPKPENNWSNPAKLYVNSTTGNLYIQDKSRVIETNPDGTYHKQYQFPFGDIEKSFVSPVSKRGWILFDNNIYQFSL